MSVVRAKSHSQSPKIGPYNIVKVHTNGNVVIQRGVVQERINIRRLTPYNEAPESQNSLGGE